MLLVSFFKAPISNHMSPETSEPEKTKPGFFLKDVQFKLP